MRVSCVEDLASHNGPESCVDVGNCAGEALTGGDAGQVLSREKLTIVQSADAVDGSGRQHRNDRYSEIMADPARSETLSMHSSTSCGSREVPRSTRSGILVRIGNSKEAIR